MELQSLKSDGLEWSSAPPSGGIAVLPGQFEGTIAPPAPPTSSAVPPAAPSTGGTFGSLFTSPIASVGVEYGRNLLKNNSVFSSGVGGWLRGSRLRYYFLINQNYIGKKIFRILMPYIQYDWARAKLEDVDEGLVAAAAGTSASPSATYQPASRDLNAPDLYIGLMSFLTFIVTMGVALGLADSFDPEMLGSTATRSLVCLLFEVALIYAGFYLSDAPVSPAVLDLFSLCGYKYVALNIDLLVGIIFGSTVFYLTFFCLGISTVFFMVRTLNGWCPSSVAALGSTPASPKFRIMFIAFAFIQMLFSLFLLYPALPTIHQASFTTRGWMTAATEAPSSTTDSLPTPVEPSPSPIVLDQPVETVLPVTPTPEPITPVTIPTTETTPTPGPVPSIPDDSTPTPPVETPTTVTETPTTVTEPSVPSSETDASATKPKRRKGKARQKKLL